MQQDADVKTRSSLKTGLFSIIISLIAWTIIVLPQGNAVECAVGPFPENFMWGVSSSGFQSEGNNPASQWTEWAATGHTRDQPGVSADLLHRYREDIKLAKAMNVNTFRIGIEWSRIEPIQGSYDSSAIAFYDDLIDSIVTEGMTPVVTLHHFSHPQWFEESGGFVNPANAGFFVTHALFIVNRYKEKVKYWITFNEPNIYVLCGFILGTWPPGMRNILIAARVNRVMMETHRALYDYIHQADPQAKVSFTFFEFQFGWPLCGVIGNCFFEQNRLLKAAADKCDYIALDYYYRYSTLREALSPLWAAPIHPEGLYRVLKKYSAAYPWLPIFIMENGMATYNGAPRSDGWTREKHLAHMLYNVQRAYSEGVNVIGYSYWSLTDNYEWGSFDPRFGLYAVDCLSDPSLERLATGAVEVYKEIIDKGSVPTAFLDGNTD
jgi:beta-glucosidase